MEFVDRGILEADLDGMVFAYDCRMRLFLAHATCVRQRSYTTRHSNILTVATTVEGRVLKHVLKSYDIFRVVCGCRKDVVALIYTTRCVLKAWR